ncbi:DUF2141 domain-containing protein [Aquimarina sp. BL5]|uniref:DUF2141 domain-containing protein n=1 Tax=Aquimarina sp. BL5 TaxID=1714860 RepID=UPI000E50202F|nr:DUF2141 domain-containing protein [Aquimarina sp. BL5]AXT50643.1 DUF2141 domain-containing protein [Aquimarina sp. BL5]RKN07121.1 DUF2141 domain-containing protein [Aquimarina sp. BL5]
MKTISITVIFTLLLPLAIFAQDNTNSIEINVTNIKIDDGTIRIGLYKGEENFYRKTYKSIAVKAKKDSLTVTLDDIPNGTYAISLFHDKNDNKKLDTNFFKIPKEPYGTSNNAKGSFGPPSWEDAKFSVSEQKVSQTIKL